jgi:peptidoglycan/LPS O-acetylase OafA/YrhL
MPLQANHDAIKYRPDIDGLRAIAIILVILYHAFPSIVRGGFAGVDIFFVISGYLITSILLKDLHSKNFSILSFYGKRARRILPALFCVLIATFFIGQKILLADEFKALGSQLLAAATFTSNFQLWQQAGYFDVASEYKPLLHLWSLAVEEQFYLFWPLILAFYFKGGNVLRRNCILILFFFSFVTNIHYAPHSQAFTFFLLPTRFWELLAGCFLAFRSKNLGEKWLSISSDKLSYLGLFSLVITLGIVSRDRPFPGWVALAPVLCAFCLIASGPGAKINRILASRILVSIGLVSYPLYLWHWPLFSFAHIYFGQDLSCLEKIELILLSGLLAYLTYRFVEKPAKHLFKNETAHSQSYRWIVVAGLSLAIVSFTGGLTAKGYFQTGVQKKSSGFEIYAHYPMLDTSCFLSPDKNFADFSAECAKAGNKATVFLWGDSFSWHYLAGLKQLLRDVPVNIVEFSSSSCPPALGATATGAPNCLQINRAVFEQVKMLHPKILILAANWSSYVQTPEVLQGLHTSIHSAKASGVQNIIMIGQTPLWKEPLYKIIARHYIVPGLEVPIRTKMGLNDLVPVDREMQDQFSKETTYVELWDKLCDSSGCRIQASDAPDSELTTFDGAHFTRSASEMIVQKYIGPTLLKMLQN